jgi:hypothetical protein
MENQNDPKILFSTPDRRLWTPDSARQAFAAFHGGQSPNHTGGFSSHNFPDFNSQLLQTDYDLDLARERQRGLTAAPIIFRTQLGRQYRPWIDCFTFHPINHNKKPGNWQIFHINKYAFSSPMADSTECRMPWTCCQALL